MKKFIKILVLLTAVLSVVWIVLIFYIYGNREPEFTPGVSKVSGVVESYNKNDLKVRIKDGLRSGILSLKVVSQTKGDLVTKTQNNTEVIHRSLSVAQLSNFLLKDSIVEVSFTVPSYQINDIAIIKQLTMEQWNNFKQSLDSNPPRNLPERPDF